MTREQLLRLIAQAAQEGRTELNLIGEQIKELPPEIGQVDNLTQLDLRYNQLSVLPPEITQLTKLTQLDLRSNQLSVLPPEITQLTNLTQLDLRSNQLSVLPPEITQLTNLTQLDLSYNQLSALPPEITQLTKLTRLDLHSNQLSALPLEVVNLSLHIDFDNNPLNDYPPEIISQGKEAVLNYLRERLKGSQQQWVSKLLAVGQGGVGKTSLLRALRGEPFDHQESTTHGIEIRTLHLIHPEDPNIAMQLNAWDFGGQDIYHATHQFFLTNRSLFLLAWNARLGFDSSKLYYWLDTIQALAPDSPVLVVATCLDERDADLPYDELRAKYPQIKGRCEISSKSGQGIEALREAITGLAMDLPLMGEEWPAAWLDTANTLRAHEEKHISPQQLWDTMTSHQVMETSRRTLARWLHELGDLLFFQDNEELNHIVILKPQWVTEYISKVLESEDVIGNIGIFTRACMDKLWQDLSPSMREHFLRLMERFDLSYRTLEDKDKSLVVERLSLEAPDFYSKWDAICAKEDSKEISMKFRLNTIPAGVPTWFIARAHRFTTRTHWRNGALFGHKDHQGHQSHLALVRAFQNDRYVELLVRGPNPHNFFALLRDGIELILARFPGLSIARKIPCPGHDGQPCTHEFDYNKLLIRLGKKDSIECLQTMNDMSVTGMLYGWDSRTQDEVLSRINELQVHLDERHDTTQAELRELRELTQREFTHAFRLEQANVDAACPNVFVLRPCSGNSLRQAVVGQQLELQLYCQMPGCWHPPRSEHGGVYRIDEPAEWLNKIAPYLRKLVGVLKYVSLAGAGLNWFDEVLYKQFKADILLTKELGSLLSEDDPADLRLIREMDLHEQPERAEGTALRALRQLLEEKDPQQHWGGLRKILTPEGHYLWLCEEHVQQYRWNGAVP